MVLRFSVGPIAVQGDLRQFYASIKLFRDQWNLQRVLIKPGLDPSEKEIEGVIVTLIWGIKCVSAQSEAAVMKLAKFVQDSNPRLASFLIDSRFVDDLGDSDEDIKTVKSLIDDADKLFESVGLACKGWSCSYEDPPSEVVEEGGYVSIGGLKWQPKLDFIEVPIPDLHFSRKVRGRIEVGTEVFNGGLLEDMDKFVPKHLSRRMILSKKASIFDLLGKLTPITAGLSLDLRKAVKDTIGWDDPVSDIIRLKWVKNFHVLHQLRGIKFSRARMPIDAISSDMDLIIAGDTAKDFLKISGVWGRFKLKSGRFSCQLLIGKSLLGHEDSSIPKEELESLMIASNLGWITRQTLDKWVTSYILISDSTISLHWVMNDKNRLSLFHRNRSVQIRRGSDLNCMYHVSSRDNPCDIGTRPDAVRLDDVGPNSRWEKGLPWMQEEIKSAVEKGILTPASSLVMLSEEEEDLFKKGFIFDKTPEILTRGHLVLPSRVEQIAGRSVFGNYLVNPAKFSFDKVVRIHSIVFRFLKSFEIFRNRLKPTDHNFRMFPCVEDPELRKLVSMVKRKDLRSLIGNKRTTSKENSRSIQDIHRVNLQSFGCEDPNLKFNGLHHILITDDDISRTLIYLFKKETLIVKKFNKSDFLKKVGIEKDGIIFSRSRILDGQRLQIATGFEDLEFLSNFNPKENGFNFINPVLDRYSPLSYSVADYIHKKLAFHKGYESCYRCSLDRVYIIQGLNLFREIGDECIRCKKLRKKYLDISMGPLAEESFMIAPPFFVCQVDIYGPCHLYVPGHTMALRNRKLLESKCYVLVFVCMISRAVNLQVIESKSADGVIEGVNRLGCEAGFPSYILTDQDSGIMKALTEAEISLKDIELNVFKEKGVRFRTAPVAGHNYHGKVERMIRSVQECLEKMGVEKMRLHATGYQTLMKLIENDLNNLPIGYGYGRSVENSPLLKLIYPNLLKLGRNNNRSLAGPVKLPGSPGELMKKVENGYRVFFELWNTVLIPTMMKTPKWYDDKSDLEIGCIVYFQKVENNLSSIWTVGKVVDIVKSKDGRVRRATVEYRNSNEDFSRQTDRAARSLIRLFHLDDNNWSRDMAEVDRLIKSLDKDKENSLDQKKYSVEQTGATSVKISVIQSPVSKRKLGDKLKTWIAMAKKPCKLCCCGAHCAVFSHDKVDEPREVDIVPGAEVEYPWLKDNSWKDVEDVEDEFDNRRIHYKGMLSLITRTDIDFDNE